MPDIETIIENDLRHAHSAANGKHFHSWVLALVASRTVGRRIEGLTRHLADELGLASVDPIEHWAKAWRLYRVIRYMAGRRQANLYRKEFSVSHFYFMWDCGHRYRLSIRQIVKYFGTLLAHKDKKERWSVDALRMLVMADRENKPASWKWHWARIDAHLDALASFDGELEPERKQWVLRGIELRRLEDEK